MAANGVIVDDDLEWEEWNPRQISFVHHMIAGSFAGLGEHICIFPIDTLKTHVQCESCGSKSPFQTWSCAVNLIKRDGIFRLWRGVTAMLAGCVPAHAAYFSIFESLKSRLGVDQEGHYPVRAAICGASATTAHDLVMTPMDVVKQRMQLGYYTGITQCIKSLISTEGVRAFYVSLPTTLTMNIPYGCIMVATNESVKKFLNPSGEANISISMIAGAIAGGVAALITNPFDIVKTRLQTHNLPPCPKLSSFNKLASCSSPSVDINNISNNAVWPRSGITEGFSIAQHIYRTEGLLGFSRGALARMMVHIPSVAVSWTVYESAKNILRNYSI